MAIDTENKRRSVTHILPLPDGTIGVFDREQVAWLYAGVQPGTVYYLDITASLTPVGGLQLVNPNWLLIPDHLNWKGEWTATTQYDDRDVVLRVFGGEEHAFVSKQSHNTGNDPITKYTWWSRFVQEIWEEGS